MDSKCFKVTEHKVPCQHVRELPQGTLTSQEEIFYLSVKQYTPLNNINPQPGDISFIASHANAFPKELYEPLWDDLIQRSETSGSFRIRDIWIADVAHQGLSSVLNEYTLGISQSWFDHSRDLLQMVNHFRIARPMMGIGHSMGGACLTQLALMHPRLMESVILIDPIIQRPMPEVEQSPALASARRRDLWPSRDVAAKSFLKSKFYQTWDPRVLDLFVKYGLRDLPTVVYPNTKTDGEDKPVTLTTTKLQEVLSFGKEILHGEPAEGFTNEEWNALRDMMEPHFDPSVVKAGPGPRSRPEPPIIFDNLKFVRPSTLWMYGEYSWQNPEKSILERVAITGTGIGGSGGEVEGRSKAVLIKGAGHLLAMEKVEDTADAMSAWIGPELERWRKNEKLFARYWATISDADKHTLGENFQNRLKRLQAKM